MSRVTAVSVAYQPDAELLNQARLLSSQLFKVVIVDNGSDMTHRTLLEDVRRNGSEVIFLPENQGIGAAHNAGIQRARELGATHVLLMDQDSVPHPDMVEKLLAAEQILTRSGKRVGALGPVYHDARLAKSWPFYRMSRFGVRPHACKGPGAISCDFLISSGTLIPMAVIDDVGPMNEAYFLEHVDTEWSLRARYKGYALYGICDAKMDHRLGDDVVAVPLSGKQVQLYRPYRHYYLFRNSVLLWREPHAVLPWKLNEIKRLVSRFIFFPLFVAPRGERLRYMLLGLWHGLRGRTGPLKA